MRPRWFKIFSDLWGNKIRSILVVASIAIGLFAVGLIASMYVILNEDMSNGFTAINPANIQFSTGDFDQELLDRVRSMEGVAAAEGYRHVNARLNNQRGEWVSVDLKAFSKIENRLLNQVQLEQGQWPPAEEQLVVDRYKFADLNTAVGGTLQLELPSGTVKEIPLVGVIQDQSIGSFDDGGGFFLAPVQGYLPLESLPWLQQPEMMNRIMIKVDGDTRDLEHIRALSSELSDEIEAAGVRVNSSAVRASDEHPNSVYVQAIASVLFLLGFLVMFMSAFLITNTLSALLNQQVNQIGIMKTIGARRGQIMSIYMLLILVFSAVAFLLALPLASRLAYALLEGLTGQLNIVLQGYRSVPLAVLLMLVIALVIPQAAGFIPIYNGTRISAVQALSGMNLEKMSSKGRKDRQTQRVRGISRPMLISLRNTFRRKGRLALTLITLTLGGAIFIATFNVQGSLTRYIERIGKYFLADVNLTLDRYYRTSEIQQLLSEVPGVDIVEGWAAANAQLVMPDDTTGETITLLGPPVGSTLVEPILLEGRWVAPGDTNAIGVNERFRELFPGLEVGDRLRFKVFGKEKDMTVVGFFQLAGRSSGYLAYTDYQSLSDLIDQEYKANTYRITSTGENLTLEDQKALGREIERTLEEAGYSVVEVQAGESLTDTTSDGLTILTSFLLIMASLIAIVGSIGLAGTLSMNVLERTRETGIMRSIGANDRTLRNLIMVEGLLIGLISWFLGTLLAFPISILLSNAINLALFGATVEFTFTPAGILVWLVVVLVLSVLASVMPARSSSRLTIREVLAYE